jgi:UDP-N-acetylmuramyl pentapeptide phosphotransferase/UDP-N-acetylglucosamine-1-phosphate transferase
MIESLVFRTIGGITASYGDLAVESKTNVLEDVYDIASFISFLIYGLFSIGFWFLLTPFIIKAADHIGAMDIPNERKVHKKPMPRLGGLGIYAGFLLGYMIFGEHTAMMNSILIGSFVLLITGIFDDIKPLNAKHKLIGQFIATLIVTLGVFCAFFVWQPFAKFLNHALPPTCK